MRYQVAINRVPMRAIVDLKTPVAQLSSVLTVLGFNGSAPDVENTYTNNGESTLCWIGPEHWWLLAPLENEGEIVSQIKDVAASDSSAVLLSDSMAFFSVTGEDAPELLAIASPLNIEPDPMLDLNGNSTSHSPESVQNRVSWTDCFGLKTLVLYHGNDHYELGIDASFAPMFADCLGKAVGADLSSLGAPV